MTGRGRRAFREAGTGKNGSFSTPSARLPPEQHGSFHRLPNPANPPHNTLKVASGLHAGRHGEAAGGGASLSPPPQCLRTPTPGCGVVLGLWGGAGPSGCPHGGLIVLGVCGSLRVRSFGCALCSGVSTCGCPLLWPGGHTGAGGSGGVPIGVSLLGGARCGLSHHPWAFEGWHPGSCPHGTLSSPFAGAVALGW